MFRLFLKDAAIDWYKTLRERVKRSWKALKDDFNLYFGKSPIDIFFAQETLFTRVHRPREKARDYVAQMQKLASKMPGLESTCCYKRFFEGFGRRLKQSPFSSRKTLK